MDITVSSRHVDVPAAVRAAATEKIGRLDRFLEMDRAEVHFSEQRKRNGNKDVCEVTLHGHGHHVRAKVAALDQFSAIDLAVAKLETQLLKLKSRLVSRYQGKTHAGRVERPAQPAVAEEAESVVEAAPAPVADGRVVKTKRFATKPMTVEEAALHMDLLGHEFFMFLHADTGEAAVLYRRNDGDLGLIELER